MQAIQDQVTKDSDFSALLFVCTSYKLVSQHLSPGYIFGVIMGWMQAVAKVCSLGLLTRPFHL